MFNPSAFSAAATAVLLAATTLPSQAQSPRIAVYRASPAAQTGDVPANAVAAARSRLPLIDRNAFPLGGRSPAAKPNGVASARAGVVVGEDGVDANRSVAPQASGSAPEEWPYTTARVAVSELDKKGKSTPMVPVTSAPYHFTGKLWMRFGSSWYVCTASLVRPGVLITAAHCVHNYGQGPSGFANQVIWYPANISRSDTKKQPFGAYNGVAWYVPLVYRDGTDTCEVVGVVCNNDIAVVVLAPVKNRRAGDTLGGYYGYAGNGYSYIDSSSFGGTVADITQLGYPAAFDQGYQMQRNNSFGKYVTGTGTNGQLLKNTQLGSALTGGSSGGPWMVNFGTRPNVDSGEASLGTSSDSNIVVGVTSWGYTAVGTNVQGASFFGVNFEFPNADYGGYGPGNVGALMQSVCTANAVNAAACAPFL